MYDVCVVGSANLDLVATVDRLPGPGETVLGHGFAEHPGGKGLNQAVAAARAGAATAFVGAVGHDAAGRTLLDVLATAGVDASRVACHGPLPSGRALIAVDAAGENAIVVVAGANGDVTGHDLPRARVVLAQLEVPVAVVAAAMSHGRRIGATTILNPAPATALPADLLAAVDVLVPNEHEVAELGGAARVLGLGVGAVVTTRGAAGVDVVTDAARWHQPAFVVAAVDTTGAGDAFCGVLAAELARGTDLAPAVRTAAAAGALAATVAGAVPALPDRQRIDVLAGDVSAATAAPPTTPG